MGLFALIEYFYGFLLTYTLNRAVAYYVWINCTAYLSYHGKIHMRKILLSLLVSGGISAVYASKIVSFTFYNETDKKIENLGLFDIIHSRNVHLLDEDLSKGSVKSISFDAAPYSGWVDSYRLSYLKEDCMFSVLFDGQNDPQSTYGQGIVIAIDEQERHINCYLTKFENLKLYGHCNGV